MLLPHTRSLRFVALFFLGAMAAIARPIELEDLFRLKRVSDPQLSPDGKTVAYVVTEVLKDENRTQGDIWVVPAGGGEARRLTNSPRHDRHPRWSPDGKWIAFESNRDGAFQIWVMPADGGPSTGSGQDGARKVTTISTEATQPVWSPKGDKLVFVSAVFPEFSAKPYAESDKLNKEKLDAREKSKVKARVITQLLYRHWDAWVEDKRQHLFVMAMKDGAAAGEPRDVTPGDNDGIPTSDTFSAGDEYAFSPDGKELAYTAPHHVVREQAWVTNHDIWTVNLESGERRQITTSPAADGFPRYSPDGKYIAYRAQARAGFEADRWQLRLYVRSSGEGWSATTDFDSSIESFDWAADSKSLIFAAQDKAAESIYSVGLNGGVKRRVAGGVMTDETPSPDGRYVYFARSRFTQPPEIFRYDLANETTDQITRTNEALLKEIDMPKPESVTVAGAGGTPVQFWIIKPPEFDAAKKYPLVFWVHGGPQGAFMDSWSTRWNPVVWAAQGYVVTLANPRGSTGFGQKFTDEISRDWSGKVYEDLMACLAHIEKLPYIDAKRMAAAGASYGGYMMNWFEGHTTKFKCIVNHDGVYNFDSMYGTTEEVWFDEWEHGQPWNSPEQAKASPHLYAANFKTPMLIIHNDLDFRVPISEGMQVFTALQRQGVPSKMLMFPDEGHWVLKPGNSELWHKTVFDWLAEYLKK